MFLSSTPFQEICFPVDSVTTVRKILQPQRRIRISETEFSRQIPFWNFRTKAFLCL